MGERSRLRLLTLLVVAALTCAAASTALATHPVPDVEVTEGSNDAIFSQNKQNEPWVAIHPFNPNILASGANDNIDLEACNEGDDTMCPFTAGVGVSGISFSFNGGATWNQPTYSGWSARACLGSVGPDPDCMPAVGPIGTLPRYHERGLVSDGDPALAFGPKPGNGGFSWSNGVRLYYANLTSNFTAKDKFGRGDEFKGVEAIAVSRLDDLGTTVPAQSAWKLPVIASTQSSAQFSDKEAIWADNASSSQFFGNVYVCYTQFRAIGGPAEPIVVARSTNGGETWSERKITQAANTPTRQGRQGCTMRTDSTGVLYVFWNGGQFGRKDLPPFANAVQFMSRSFDGGLTFEKPRVVANAADCGQFDPNQRRLTFDGVGGARTNSFPSVDISNGAPTGAGATNRIVLAWCNGPTPTNTSPGPNEQALVQFSTNQGVTWSTPVNGALGTHRPDFPAVAISPDGQDIYLTYMNFLQPWQNSAVAPARLMQGVVRHANFGATLTFTSIHTGPTGDARGSSTNSLVAEFLGDYNYVYATNDFAYAVWNDVRNAADCPAIDTYRQNLATGVEPNPTPAPQQACAPTFGNSDIFGTRVNDPS